MDTSLTDSDLDRIAVRVVGLIAGRLSLTTPSVAEASNPHEYSGPQPPVRLVYSLKELASELGVSRVTIYRLEVRGLIKCVPGIRHKLYSKLEVERFLAGKHGSAKNKDRL